MHAAVHGAGPGRFVTEVDDQLRAAEHRDAARASEESRLRRGERRAERLVGRRVDPRQQEVPGRVGVDEVVHVELHQRTVDRGARDRVHHVSGDRHRGALAQQVEGDARRVTGRVGRHDHVGLREEVVVESRQHLVARGLVLIREREPGRVQAAVGTGLFESGEPGDVHAGDRFVRHRVAREHVDGRELLVHDDEVRRHGLRGESVTSLGSEGPNVGSVGNACSETFSERTSLPSKT